MSAGFRLVESTNISVVIKYIFPYICENSLYALYENKCISYVNIYNCNKNEMFAKKILDHQGENKYYLYLILSE